MSLDVLKQEYSIYLERIEFLTNAKSNNLLPEERIDFLYKDYKEEFIKVLLDNEEDLQDFLKWIPGLVFVENFLEEVVLHTKNEKFIAIVLTRLNDIKMGLEPNVEMSTRHYKVVLNLVISIENKLLNIIDEFNEKLFII